MIEAEQAVIDYSRGKTQINIPEKKAAKKKEITVQYLTEGKILKHLVDEINEIRKKEILFGQVCFILPIEMSLMHSMRQATEELKSILYLIRTKWPSVTKRQDYLTCLLPLS